VLLNSRPAAPTKDKDDVSQTGARGKAGTAAANEEQATGELANGAFAPVETPPVANSRKVVHTTGGCTRRRPRSCRRVDADTEIVNAIQTGKLKIVARLGELTPAKTKQEAGKIGGKAGGVGRPKAKGKATGPPPVAFSDKTGTKYRRVAAHKAKIDEYKDSRKPGKGGTPSRGSPGRDGEP
jgi:hypothetical protein